MRRPEVETWACISPRRVAGQVELCQYHIKRLTILTDSLITPHTTCGGGVYFDAALSGDGIPDKDGLLFMEVGKRDILS
jgi:hypothetical protein